MAEYDTQAHQAHRILTAKQVAAILNVPYKRVYELDIPRLRYSSKSIRWRFTDVIAWLASREQRPTTHF